MKIMYILGALMLIGAMLMFVSAVKAMDAFQTVKMARVLHRSAPIVTPATQYYLMAGYLGLAFFVVGAVGALIAVIQLFNRRF